MRGKTGKRDFKVVQKHRKEDNKTTQNRGSKEWINVRKRQRGRGRGCPWCLHLCIKWWELSSLPLLPGDQWVAVCLQGAANQFTPVTHKLSALIQPTDHPDDTHAHQEVTLQRKWWRGTIALIASKQGTNIRAQIHGMGVEGRRDVNFHTHTHKHTLHYISYSWPVVCPSSPLWHSELQPEAQLLFWRKRSFCLRNTEASVSKLCAVCAWERVCAVG